MPKGYLVATLVLTDPDAYGPYREQVPALIERHGGRYLVRGGAVEALEGVADFSRVVVVEFPSVAAVRSFYSDPDYQRIVPLRTDNAQGTLIVAEGVGD
mgnify:CR=1 FL=1